ncbi:MAG: SDR family oxidoreductase [Ardenticatenaceae bacterium]|nr:SDR family oxidoreductase [Ardenticatenaceae bacterium]
MNLNIENKVAIVTGGGKGLGSTVAKLLGQNGVKVAVNDINPDRAEKVADSIRSSGGQAIGIGADIANKFQCVHLIETTRAEWGQLDILVNHAAVEPQATILKMDEWDWQRCLDVNLKGAFFMSQLVGRVMADENEARGGSIINLGRTAGLLLPLESRAAYCASQAGLVGFARECAREFQTYGIRVNTILQHQTSLTTGPLVDEIPSQISSWLKEQQLESPIAAQIVLALCSEMGHQISGTVIPVDDQAIMG